MKKARSLSRLVDDFTGSRGVAFGAAPRKGMHLVIHEGDGATGNWTGVTFSNRESVAFINNLVGATTNAEHLPAVRELIDAETRSLRAEITQLRCQLLQASLVPVSSTPVRPYSDATALVVAPCLAIALASGSQPSLSSEASAKEEALNSQPAQEARQS